MMVPPESLQRLFIALWPPAEVREAMQALAQGFTSNHCRPVVPSNLHMTLAFVGAVPHSTEECLRMQLDELRAEAFVMQLDLVGAWSRPRVLWLAPTVSPAALLRLAAQVETVICPCGYAPDTRPYQPHVTLARGLSADAARQPDQSVTAIVWPVEDLVLVQSVSEIAGVRYQVLQHWVLNG